MKQKTEMSDGTDIEINNRNIVLIFIGLLAICGVCFVTGYVMGSGSAPPPANYAAANAAVGDSGIKDAAVPKANNSIYEPIGEMDAPPALIEPSPAEPGEAISDAASNASVSMDSSITQQKETQSKTTTPVKQTDSAMRVYSVQVAAFDDRRKAEVKAKELESKGFECVIDPPTTDKFFRIKVGSFATRAEAGVMATRLKESGFETMIRETRGN